MKVLVQQRVLKFKVHSKSIQRFQTNVSSFFIFTASQKVPCTSNNLLTFLPERIVIRCWELIGVDNEISIGMTFKILVASLQLRIQGF